MKRSKKYDGIDPAVIPLHRAHEKQITEARRMRKRAVRLALQTGGTVPYDYRTLIEDGWSNKTIRRVMRGEQKRGEWKPPGDRDPRMPGAIRIV